MASRFTRWAMGRTSRRKRRRCFSHVFNYPANYWDAASVIREPAAGGERRLRSRARASRCSITTRYGGNRSARCGKTLFGDATGSMLARIADWTAPPDRSRATSGCRSAASVPITSRECGAGGAVNEPGRGAGSHQHPFPDGRIHRQCGRAPEHDVAQAGGLRPAGYAR